MYFTLKELKESTEDEESHLVRRIRKREAIARYVYSENAHGEIITTEKQPFLAMRIILQPKARTKIEQDPRELGRFEKLVYGLRGKAIAVVGPENHTIGKDEAIIFESTLPHYFENPTPKKTVLLVIQNPKHI